MISAGGSPEVFAGMTQGKFQAGVLTPPTSTMAAKAGYREIFDLASLDFPFPVISVVSTRRYIEANPETILNILRATAEAIYLYRTRPELTLPVVAKFMRVPKDDPALGPVAAVARRAHESKSGADAGRHPIRARLSRRETTFAESEKSRRLRRSKICPEAGRRRLLQKICQSIERNYHARRRCRSRYSQDRRGKIRVHIAGRRYSADLRRPA